MAAVTAIWNAFVSEVPETLFPYSDLTASPFAEPGYRSGQSGKWYPFVSVLSAVGIANKRGHFRRFVLDADAEKKMGRHTRACVRLCLFCAMQTNLALTMNPFPTEISRWVM